MNDLLASVKVHPTRGIIKAKDRLTRWSGCSWLHATVQETGFMLRSEAKSWKAQHCSIHCVQLMLVASAAS